MSDSLEALAWGVFDQAIDRDGADRSGYLTQACAAVPGLRARVEALLAAAERQDSFLAEPTFCMAESPNATAAGEQPGTWIGPFRLIEQIGEGGFGSVFRAEQSVPVRRQVALKIIKLGMDTRQVIARFEAERQLLALMEHPNIAKIYDAGATESGRPYFAMELVDGRPVTRYCDDMRLSIPQRLELFREVCGAVQHAHQKGVIHRDLKPSNVLASTHENRPLCRIIDFGIAKVTQPRLLDQSHFSHFTGPQQFIGTPEYMSPEQAAGTIDIDTRSDLYSLGVLLYELLAGATPFDARRLRESGYDGMRHILSQEEPPRPSDRLRILAESSEVRLRTPTNAAARLPSVDDIARERRLEPLSLTRTIRGDLDWIVMKCLEKDRDRRYPTAAALADDIGRYLENQPVLATPPSAGYRLRKFVRRNRTAVVTAAAVAASLVLGVIGTTLGLLRAQAHAANAESARAAEQRQRQRSDVINQFMTKALQASDPRQGGQQEMLVADAMLRAVKQIDAGAFADDPQTEADLLGTISSILLSNGKPTEALPLAERSKALLEQIFLADHPDRADGMHKLASVLLNLGRAAEAEPLARDALEMYERLYPGDHPTIATGLTNLADVLRSSRRFDEAEPLFRRALAMNQRLYPGDHLEVTNSINNLAVVLRGLGNVTEAEALHREALAMDQRFFKDDHPLTADHMYNLASVLQGLGRPAEAMPFAQDALAMRRRLFQGDHPDVAATLSMNQHLLSALGKDDEAEPLARETLEMYQRIYRDDHKHVARSMANFGILLRKLGRSAEAEEFARNGLAMRQRLFTADHPDIAHSLENLGLILQDLGSLAEAESYFRQAVETRRRIPGENEANVGAALDRLIFNLRRQGKLAEAEPFSREALAIQRRLAGDDHIKTVSAIIGFGLLLAEQGKLAEAEPYCREVLEKRDRVFKDELVETLIARYRLGQLLQGLGKPAEVVDLLAPIELAARRVFTGRSLRHLGSFLTTLGCVRASTGELDAADAILNEAYAIVSQANGATDLERANVLTALVELNDARHTAEPERGHDARAAEWRRKLEEWQASAQPAKP